MKNDIVLAKVLFLEIPMSFREDIWILNIEFIQNIYNYAYPGLKGSPGGLKLTIKVAVSGFRSKGDWGPIELRDILLSNLKPENNEQINIV